MNRLNELSEHFKRKDIELLEGLCRRDAEENDGVPQMSPSELKLACLRHKGCYDSPELNDKLYLHFRAFRKIENLTPYKNLKALWLDSNCIKKIEGLEACQQLRCLFVSKNALDSISGLSTLKQLTTLDISYNRIVSVCGLSECSALQNLNISHNAIHFANSLEHLTLCNNLQTLDIVDNNIESSDDIIEVLTRISSLVSLSISGNKCTQSAGFRKRMIANIRRLSYLDRPIEELERVAAVAYVSGGAQEEMKARDAFKVAAVNKNIFERAKLMEWKQSEKERRVVASAEKRRGFSSNEIVLREQKAKIDTLKEREYILGQLHDWADSTKGRNDAVEVTEQNKESEWVMKGADNSVNYHLEKENNSFENMGLVGERMSESIDDYISGNLEMLFGSTVDLTIYEGNSHLSGDQEAILFRKFSSQLSENYVSRDFDDHRTKLVVDSLTKMKLLDKQLPMVTRKGTWHHTAVQEDVFLTEYIQKPDVFYWNEDLDEELRKLVESCNFDFSLIASLLKERCEQGHFGLLQSYALDKIDEELCRRRFDYLELK